MEQILNSMRIFDSFLSVTQYMLMSILYVIAYVVIENKNPAIIFWLIYVVVPLLDDYIPWKITNPDHEEAKYSFLYTIEPLAQNLPINFLYTVQFLLIGL